MDEVVNSAEMLPNPMACTGSGSLHPSWASFMHKENILLSSWLRTGERELCNADITLVGARDGWGTKIIVCKIKMCMQHLSGGLFLQAFGFKFWFIHTKKQ